MNIINLDFVSIHKKEPEKKRPANIPKREVRGVDNDLVLINKKARQLKNISFILPVKFKEHYKQKNHIFSFPARSIFIRTGAFALAGLLLVGLIQGVNYYFSAKNTSAEILGVSTSAYSDLESAQQNLMDQNLGPATQLFTSAENSLLIAQEKLNNFKIVKWIFPPAQSADRVLTGAGLLAQSGEKLTAALALFNELKVSSKGIETSQINEKIGQNKQLLSESLSLIKEAEGNFDQAKDLPLEYNSTLEQARIQVSSLRVVLENLTGLEDLYLSLFGEQNKTYLLVFQNPDEARATGGFIGTYGVLQINNGRITKLKIDSIYNLDGNIFDQIAAPGPMQPLIKKWGTRDANWFVDFRQSANKLLYFFEKGQETADGVIAVTPKLFEDLLTIVGPIPMPAYGVELTPGNFQDVVQFKTSVDYDPVLNQPKKFLADFAPVFLNRLSGLQKEDWLRMLQIFEQGLKTRQILLYSRDGQAQEIIEQLGFSGAVLPAAKDYLSIVNTNLGGTKTDLHINQKANLQSKLLSDGTIINTLTISRENPTKEINKDYIRILVPSGSSLISAGGFDSLDYHSSEADGFSIDSDLAKWDQGESKFDKIFIRQEANKTEFAGWINLGPESDRTVTLSYILPFQLNLDFITNSSSYSLLVQKQAGATPFGFTGDLDFEGYKIKWLGNGVEAKTNGISFGSNSNSDDFWSAVLTR